MSLPAKQDEHAPTPIELREIALAALVDNRTLSRALRGERVKDLTLERIRRALEARGLLHLMPPEVAR
jgi:hypothetical protein